MKRDTGTKAGHERDTDRDERDTPLRGCPGVPVSRPAVSTAESCTAGRGFGQHRYGLSHRKRCSQIKMDLVEARS